MLISLSLSTISMLRLALADVVERLERHAASSAPRRPPRPRSSRACRAASRARARPSAMDRPVPAWPPSNMSCGLSLRRGNPPMPPSWRSVPKSVESARQQLVGVGLVTGIPDDLVGRDIEQPVQRDGQLHHAERAAQVAAGLGDRPDDRAADLRAELRSCWSSSCLMSRGLSMFSRTDKNFHLRVRASEKGRVRAGSCGGNFTRGRWSGSPLLHSVRAGATILVSPEGVAMFRVGRVLASLVVIAGLLTACTGVTVGPGATRSRPRGRWTSPRTTHPTSDRRRVVGRAPSRSRAASLQQGRAGDTQTLIPTTPTTDLDTIGSDPGRRHRHPHDRRGGR